MYKYLYYAIHSSKKCKLFCEWRIKTGKRGEDNGKRKRRRAQGAGLFLVYFDVIFEDK